MARISIILFLLIQGFAFGEITIGEPTLVNVPGKTMTLASAIGKSGWFPIEWVVKVEVDVSGSDRQNVKSIVLSRFCYEQPDESYFYPDYPEGGSTYYINNSPEKVGDTDRYVVYAGFYWRFCTIRIYGVPFAKPSKSWQFSPGKNALSTTRVVIETDGSYMEKAKEAIVQDAVDTKEPVQLAGQTAKR